MQHISGSDVYVTIGTALVHVNQFTVSIEDGMTATSTHGVPNGYVGGAATASGEIRVDTENFKLILAEAKSAGSFQRLEPFDIISLGKTVDQEFKVAAFGCKLTISSLLDANADGGSKLEHTIPYQVTDSRFVEIDDVPYIDQDRLTELGL
ncbi:MAG: DUF2597 domain-containing protein [Marinomonas sp.]|nr:MAG: DUF2597 domain-containing protein [Marinomonas sp.]